MAELSLCLLRHGAPYLREIRFSHSGVVLADLNASALDSVPDWSSASVPDAMKLLVAADTSSAQRPPASDSWTGILAKTRAVSEDSVEQSQLTGDSRRLRDAQEAFRQTVNAKNEQLRWVLQKQDQASRLSDFLSRSDLQTRLVALSEDARVLKEVRGFFLDQDREFQRALDQAQLDPLLVSIEVRTLSQRQALRRPYLEAFFQALANRQRSIEQFLTAMEQVWGDWSTSGGMIQFSSQNAQNTYQLTSAQLKQANDQVSSTMQAWNNWEAAQR
jgi:hypothetical protein